MTTPIRKAPLSWERLPEESAKAYRAFSFYRDMGAERSIDKACNLFYADQGKKRGSARRTGQWAKWAQQHHWVDRAEIYDDLMEKEKREAGAARRRKLQDQRAQFEDERPDGNSEAVVDTLNASLHKMGAAVTTEVTQTKTDPLTGVKTVTKFVGPKGRDYAALVKQRHDEGCQAGD